MSEERVCYLNDSIELPHPEGGVLRIRRRVSAVPGSGDVDYEFTAPFAVFVRQDDLPVGTLVMLFRTYGEAMLGFADKLVEANMGALPDG